MKDPRWMEGDPIAMGEEVEEPAIERDEMYGEIYKYDD